MNDDVNVSYLTGGNFNWIDVCYKEMNDLIVLQSDIVIHASKFHSFFEKINLLVNCFKPDESLEFDSIKEYYYMFIKMIKDIKDIAINCSADKWSEAVIKWPSKHVAESIQYFHENVGQCLEVFGCIVPPDLHVSVTEIEAQDDVDAAKIRDSLANFVCDVNNGKVKNVSSETVKHIETKINSIDPVCGLNNTLVQESIPPFLSEDYTTLFLTHECFEINDLIGSGTFGHVYKGVIRSSGTKVAVKVLSCNALGGRQLETFKREVWTLATLNHPSILKLIGVTLESPFCIITELLNSPLNDRLDVLTPSERSIVAFKVAQGMYTLHMNKIIHRDLKSANILLDDNNFPRVGDFGLVGFKTNVTRTGCIGTAQWMAPEMLRSSPYYDEKVDVYSFGILLWEMLTNSTPYTGMNHDTICFNVLKGMRPEIPEKFENFEIVSLIRACWDSSPSKRPSFKDIVEALFRPLYHFPNTDEMQFLLLFFRSLVCDKKYVDNTIDTECNKLVNPIVLNFDENLIPMVIHYFKEFDDLDKVKVLHTLPKLLDFPKFFSSSGKNFFMSILHYSEFVADALVDLVRTVPLGSDEFKCTFFIKSLFNSNHKSAILLLADLAEFTDVSKYLLSDLLPFKSEGNEREKLRVYHSILLHKGFQSSMDQYTEPLTMAKKIFKQYPDEVCSSLEFFYFFPSHVETILSTNIIEDLFSVSDYCSEALRILCKIFAVLSVNQLKPYVKIIDCLFYRHQSFFIVLAEKLSSVEGSSVQIANNIQAQLTYRRHPHYC